MTRNDTNERSYDENVAHLDRNRFMLMSTYLQKYNYKKQKKQLNLH